MYYFPGVRIYNDRLSMLSQQLSNTGTSTAACFSPCLHPLYHAPWNFQELYLLWLVTYNHTLIIALCVSPLHKMNKLFCLLFPHMPSFFLHLYFCFVATFLRIS